MNTVKFMSLKEFATDNSIVGLTCLPKHIEYTDSETGEKRSKLGYYFCAKKKDGSVSYYGCSFNFDPKKEIQVRINEELEYPVCFVNNMAINFDHLL